MAVSAAAAVTRRLPSSYASVEHMFDLDEALTMPVMSFPEACFLPAEALSMLPVASDADVNNLLCSICTEGFTNGGAAGKRLPCEHVYHAHCISTWLSRCNSCPLCRAQVPL